MDKARIMIVEDEIIVAEDLTMVIIGLGYEVAGRAGSAEQAINMAVELQPDLILMDIVLKGKKNGLDASREIRETMDIPIIFLTSHSDLGLIDKIKDTEAYGYIIKPFQKKQLYASIEMALHNSKMALKLREEKIKYRKLSEELEIHVAERTAKLEASNEELEAFIYSVSHDLRAPLRHISGFSHILLNKYYNQVPDDAGMYLKKISESTNYMNTLINGLLNLSRVGRQGLNIRPVELNRIINEAIEELEPDLLDRDMEWNICKLPEVDCDPELMRIVVDNLLLNAVKFTANTDNAVITIDQLPNGRPGFLISDNGVGFDIKNYDKLFKVFQRLHMKDDFEGTGIGLATVHKIVTRHDGHIWAKAQINQGATFYIELPVMENMNNK